MRTLRQLLDEKGRNVWSLQPDESVYRAVEIMAERGVGALMVIGRDGPVGVVSERDYARKIILKGRASSHTAVSEIMTSDIVYASIDDGVEACLALMTERRIRHLPVLEDGELAGMISIGDLVKAVIADQQFVIEQLEHYITA